MYVPRVPSGDVLARQHAHQALLERAATERAMYAHGWRYVGEVGEPAFTTLATGTGVAFFRNSMGWVLLAGSFNDSGASAFDGYGLSTTPWFTLPVGYRPARTGFFSTGDTLIGVRPGGGVYGGTSRAGGPWDLDPIRFRVD